MALIEKKKFHFISLSPQLSLTSASLSYQAAMAEVVQAMRDREKETITINTTPQINIPQSHTKNPNPIHSQRPRPKKKKRKKKKHYNQKREWSKSVNKICSSVCKFCREEANLYG